MTESEEQQGPASFITLHLDTGDREFLSINELEEWLNNERSFFSWMESGPRIESGCSPAWNTISPWLSQVNKYIGQYQQHKNNEAQIQNITNNLHSNLNQSLEKGFLLTSTNPDAIFLSTLSTEEDAAIASYATCNLLGIHTNQNSPRALKGAFYAFQYQQGAPSTVKSQAESLNGLFKEWTDRFQAYYVQVRSLNEQTIVETEKSKHKLSQLHDNADSQTQEQNNEFNKRLEEYSQTLTDIAKTYDEKLALQASVQYWSDKRKLHTKVMIWMGGATLLLSGLTGAGFVYAAHHLLQITFKDVELWRLGVMLAISTFGIWITRLSAKIFISNLHLRTDADERVTMIQTYLALLREGAGPQKDERQLILQTLFRPSTTGFIQDEGPSAFHEIIQNALNRK